MVCNGHTKNASSVVTSFQVNFLIKSWILMKEKKMGFLSIVNVMNTGIRVM